MTLQDSQLQRSLGRVEGNQGAMEARMDRLESAVCEGFKDVKLAISEMRADFDKRLESLEAREHQLRGVWWVLASVATLVGAVGGLAANHFWV